MRLMVYSVKLLAMLFTVMSASLSAQVVEKLDISIGQKITLSSEVLDENRNIMIYTPADMNEEQQYQVIYLFDAEYLFTSAVGIVDALVTSRKIPPSIIVGVETTVRVRDYLPPIVAAPQSNQQRWISHKFPQFGGGTKNFTRFLQTELFPYVERHFAVLPSRTLIGYSNAGVYGLHTLVNSPDLFTNYLLISPAAWWSEQQVDANLAQFSEHSKNYSGNLFLSVANEGRGIYSNAFRIAAKLESLAPRSLNWTFKHFEDETHQSTTFPSIYQGLTALFKDLHFKVTYEHGQYASINDIATYYATLSERYGYTVSVPEIVFSDLSDAQFEFQRKDEAIKTLKQFVEAYPSSSFSHSSLGRGYMQTEQFELAKQHFEAAIKIVKLKQVSDPSVLDFLNDMVKAAESKI